MACHTTCFENAERQPKMLADPASRVLHYSSSTYELRGAAMQASMHCHAVSSMLLLGASSVRVQRNKLDALSVVEARTGARCGAGRAKNTGHYDLCRAGFTGAGE